MEIRYTGEVSMTALEGGDGQPCDLETCVSYHDGDPVVTLVVRTYDARTAEELDPQGVGMTLEEAQELHGALGEAIRAAQKT